MFFRHLPLLARPRLRDRGIGTGRRRTLRGARMEGAFWFVALSMLVSGAVLWLLGEETHPRLKPATGAAP